MYWDALTAAGLLVSITMTLVLYWLMKAQY